ncbi:hypothetical protein Tco_0522557 [Tanacetum coccineum]
MSCLNMLGTLGFGLEIDSIDQVESVKTFQRALKEIFLESIDVSAHFIPEEMCLDRPGGSALGIMGSRGYTKLGGPMGKQRVYGDEEDVRGVEMIFCGLSLKKSIYHDEIGFLYNDGMYVRIARKRILEAEPVEILRVHFTGGVICGLLPELGSGYSLECRLGETERAVGPI